MARIARKNLNGNIFHVICKGFNGGYIFDKSYLKEEYWKLIIENLDDYNLTLLSGALMDNHSHLMLNADDNNHLSSFFQKVNSKFAIFYNNNENKTGYVFNNRFYSKFIVDRKNLLAAFSYIHNNPVKAGIVKNPGKYEFSTFNEYLKDKSDIISDKAKLIMFNSVNKEDYLEYYYNLHKRSFDVKIFDIKEDINIDLIFKNLTKNNVSFDNIIKILFKKYDFSERSIANYLNLTRYQVRKILGKEN